MSNKDFIPNPAQMALKPDVSGNDINGLGEVEIRQPRYVYWGNDPDDVAHGAMQKWFYTVDPGLDEFANIRVERQAILDAPLVPLASEPQELTPDIFVSYGAQSITNGVFDKIGVTDFDPLWAFEGMKITQSKIIILGFQHSYDEISKAPAPEGGLEVMRQYMRAAKGAKDTANWLRSMGWDAEPLTGPMSGKVTMIPPALAAGFGELGKHGSIITPEFGSSFRLSAVLTDAPLSNTPPRQYGIDDFCTHCKICEKACPTDAISSEKQVVRGVKKWYVDFDQCLPFFNEHQGCAICIAVCPWSRPGIGENLMHKLAARAVRLDTASSAPSLDAPERIKEPPEGTKGPS